MVQAGLELLAVLLPLLSQHETLKLTSHAYSRSDSKKYISSGGRYIILVPMGKSFISSAASSKQLALPQECDENTLPQSRNCFHTLTDVSNLSTQDT